DRAPCIEQSPQFTAHTWAGGKRQRPHRCQFVCRHCGKRRTEEGTEHARGLAILSREAAEQLKGTVVCFFGSPILEDGNGDGYDRRTTPFSIPVRCCSGDADAWIRVLHSQKADSDNALMAWDMGQGPEGSIPDRGLGVPRGQMHHYPKRT